MNRNNDLSNDATLLSAVMNTILDGLIVIDNRGTIMNINPATQRLFGYEANEVIGKNVKVLMPEPYHSEHDSYLNNYMETRQAKVIGIGREVAAKRKDGSVFPVELGVNEMTIDGNRMFVGTIHNITERKEHEKALKESEKRYDLAVKGLSVGIWDWNIATNELYWSPLFKQIIGINDENFIPDYHSFESRLHPEDKEHTLALLKNHIDKKGDFKVEYRLRKEDGTYVWIHARGQALWDENGKPVRMVGSVDDITSRKYLEDEREKLITQLTESNDKLERFAYIASHDLQEPLRMITNFTGLLVERTEQKFDDKEKQMFFFVKNGAEHMQSLIADILEYSRITEEHEKNEEINVKAIFDNVLINLQEEIKTKKATISKDTLPDIYGNPMRFSRLLQNLISNSLKYQKADSVPHVHLSVSDMNDSHWLFCIEDNGIGMKQQYCTQIFVPFKRLHNRFEYPGTGIGLAICKKIVESFGGTIWAESEENKGSKFYFTIPKLIKRKVAI